MLSNFLSISDFEISQNSRSTISGLSPLSMRQLSISTAAGSAPPGIVDLIPHASTFSAIGEAGEDAANRIQLFRDDPSQVPEIVDFLRQNPGVIGCGDAACVDACLNDSVCRNDVRMVGVLRFEQVDPQASFQTTSKEGLKFLLKQAFEPLTTGIGKLAGEVYQLGELGVYVVGQAAGQVIGKIIDFFVGEQTGDARVIIAEAANQEVIQVPTGTHHIIHSFSDDDPRSFFTDIPVNQISTTVVEFSPGGGWSVSTPYSIAWPSIRSKCRGFC